jgi:hypothetical protein
MLKETVSAQDVCDLLNELLLLDPICVNNLISNRVECNESIANHPTAQVHQYIDDESPKIGLLGVLNGLFGTGEDGRGILFCEVDLIGRIKEFNLTKEVK